MDATEFIKITKWIEDQNIKIENIETKKLVSIFDLPKLLEKYYNYKIKLKDENTI